MLLKEILLSPVAVIHLLTRSKVQLEMYAHILGAKSF